VKAVILAAGTGARLGEPYGREPKALLRFGDKSLLERHIGCLRRLGIAELVVGVGFHHDDIRREIDRLEAGNLVRTVFNPDFTDGSMVTLWTLRDELRCGAPVLLMDADVLYPDALLRRLVASQHRSCLLLDRDFEPGDEPVRVGVSAGRIVDFRKRSSVPCDFRGESVGFFKLSPGDARALVAHARSYIDRGACQEPYEEAIRDLLLGPAADGFGYEDITGEPWIEIDFPADVERARLDILPRISAAEKQAPQARGQAGGGARLP